MSSALVPYTGTAADYWVALAEDARRRQAIEACTARDFDVLWHLTNAYLSTFSAAGGALSPLTRSQYRVGVKRLLAAWQHEELRKPRRDAAALWLRHLETQGMHAKDGTVRGLKPASVQVYLAAARMLYAALRWAGATTADPFADLRPARDAVAKWDKRRPYDDLQVAKMLDVAEPLDAVVILLCAHAGLRISEVVALGWEEIDLERRELTVLRGKGGKRRSVPLSRSLVDHLELLRHAQELQRDCVGALLPYRERQTAWRRLRSVAVAAGVPWLGLHAFRHTAGTRIYRQTESVELTARMLGHQQLETSRIYAKMSDTRLKRALDEW